MHYGTELAAVQSFFGHPVPTHVTSLSWLYPGYCKGRGRSIFSFCPFDFSCGQTAESDLQKQTQPRVYFLLPTWPTQSLREILQPLPRSATEEQQSGRNRRVVPATQVSCTERVHRQGCRRCAVLANGTQTSVNINTLFYVFFFLSKSRKAEVLIKVNICIVH
jgi:hypothetical protein